VYSTIYTTEVEAAEAVFIDRASDLAAKIAQDYRTQMRELRLMANRLGAAVSVTRALPSRNLHRTVCHAARLNPERTFTGIAFVVNVTHESRAAFETTLSKELNTSIFIKAPTRRTMPAPAAPYYLTALHLDEGTESVHGFDASRIGLSLTSLPSMHALHRRTAEYGRVLASEPQISPEGVHGHFILLLLTTAVYVDQGVFSRSSTGNGSVGLPPRGANTSTVIPYCAHLDRDCDVALQQQGAPSADVNFVAQLLPLEVPLCGVVPGSWTENIGVVIPLSATVTSMQECACAQIPGGPCDDFLLQNIAASAEIAETQRKYTTVGTAQRLHVGQLVASIYADIGALGVLHRFRVRDMLIGVEDVTGVAGFEFLPLSRASDECITSLPVESWDAVVTGSKGLQPITRPAGTPALATTVPTLAGPVRLSQPEHGARKVFRYGGGPAFSAGSFLLAIDGRLPWSLVAPRESLFVSNASVSVGSSIDPPDCHPSAAPCRSWRAGNQTLVACPPSITPADFRAEIDRALFNASFVTMVGDRMWRIQCLAPQGYSVQHSSSFYALAGGVVSVALLTALVVGAAVVRAKEGERLQERAATRAHGK
jgi:hypothetical protein